MKSRILLVIIAAGFGLQSCQSEYGERMDKALKLKREYEKVQSDMYGSKNPSLKIQLSEIEKEIQFHAVLSGNEPLFLKEIWKN